MQRLIPLGFVAIYLALALRLMAIFVPCSHFGDNGGWATHDGVYPTRPLAYRVLVPWMTDALIFTVPNSARNAIWQGFVALRESDLGKWVVARSETRLVTDENGMKRLKPGICKFYNFSHQEAKKRLIDNQHIFYTGILMLVVFGWMLAFLGMLYALARVLFETSAYALAAPLVALLMLPKFMSQYAYTYDFAEMFFCCAGLYLLHERRFGAYLACFALATLNKETSIYLVVFFAAWFLGRMPFKTYCGWLFWQIAIFIYIKLFLYIHFMETPGQIIGNFLGINLFLFTHMGFHSKLLLLGLLGIFLYGWRSKPIFLRVAMVMIPVNVAAYMVASFPGEYRSFFGSLPVVMLLITHTLVKASHLDYFCKIFVASRIWVRARIR